jgi:hypothetical protein
MIWEEIELIEQMKLVVISRLVYGLIFYQIVCKHFLWFHWSRIVADMKRQVKIFFLLACFYISGSFAIHVKLLLPLLLLLVLLYLLLFCMLFFLLYCIFVYCCWCLCCFVCCSLCCIVVIYVMLFVKSVLFYFFRFFYCSLMLTYVSGQILFGQNTICWALKMSHKKDKCCADKMSPGQNILSIRHHGNKMKSWLFIIGTKYHAEKIQ